ncbi:MAG: hypothetical protein Kow0090_06860 [Myxococcota bacterium]
MNQANEQVKKLLTYAAALDKMDYFQILGIAYTAEPDVIRAAYRKASRNFHPDRYSRLTDETLKAAIYKISKRVAEAYTVLKDDEKRKVYLKLVQSPERMLHLRFSETQEEVKKKEKEEEIGTTPQGRQFYQQGIVALKRKRFQEAESAFKSALMYEPENELYKEKLREAEKGNVVDFKIR